MREIKFRGKRLDNGEWIYGGYHRHVERTICPIGVKLKESDVSVLIITSGFSDWNMPKPLQAIKVDPTTIGQFTGMYDENGKEIYEGDIVLFTSSWNQTEAYKKRYGSKETVKYKDGAFTNCTPGGSTEKGDIIEVIGNIHERKTEQ